MKNIKRVAVWSGPRNLSTALMRSFGTRSDFAILDEPFYAAYLKKTGIQHPMFDKIISSQLSNYKEVALCIIFLSFSDIFLFVLSVLMLVLLLKPVDL